MIEIHLILLLKKILIPTPRRVVGSSKGGEGYEKPKLESKLKSRGMKGSNKKLKRYFLVEQITKLERGQKS